MRVIAGEYKGRRLASVSNADIRYTADRVKESLFSILRDSIVQSRFLDVFAGSGNIGIEAISRGAALTTFVEANPACARAISANLERLGLSPRPDWIKLLNMRMERATRYFQKHGAEFDIIFLDPPYLKDFVERTLKRLSTSGILLEDGQVIAEHHIKEVVPEVVGNLQLTRQNVYGTVALSFYNTKT